LTVDLISAPHPSGHRTLLPVGPAYLRHLQLLLHHSHSFSSLDKHLNAERERLAALHGEDAAGEDDLGVGDEEEPEELLNLDPKEWKVRFYLFKRILVPPSKPFFFFIDRNKIIMPCLGSLISDTQPARSRSKSHVCFKNSFFISSVF